MAIFIFLIILFIIIKFLADKNKEVTKVKRQGGMKEKYSLLINYFLDYPNARILECSSSQATIIVRDTFAITIFRIAHGFNDFTVFWEHQSTTFGEHKLYWKFPEYMNQTNVINVIENELNEYAQRTMTKSL